MIHLSTTTRKALAYIFFPLTVWYGVGVWFRNLLFDIGLLRSVPSPLKSVGVGNLSTGGTGKTPHAEYLLQLLSQQGSVAFLSRGYRRKSHGYVQCEVPDAALLGDEPAMIARKHPYATVAVCEKRVEGLRRLREQNADLRVVMDDVMQHRYVRPTVMVLLTEHGHLYSDDQVLPFGNLRESRRGSKRADIIVVTKCPDTLSLAEQESIRRRLRAGTIPVFFSYYAYQMPPSLPERATLLTGIAHPEPLVERLSALTQLTHHRYPDHHAFTQQEIDALPQGCPLLTTEKDAARLQRLDMGGRPLIPIPIEVRFHPSEKSFDQTLLEAIS